MSLFFLTNAAKAAPTDLPMMTTDLENPVYYTISNTRSASGRYLYYAGDSVGLRDADSISVASLFFFTGSTDSCCIHNAATTKKVASVTSWTDEGAVWAINVTPYGDGTTGLSIGPWDNSQGRYCWNEFTYNDCYTTWDANDSGSIFVIELYGDEVPEFPETPEPDVTVDTVAAVMPITFNRSATSIDGYCYIEGAKLNAEGLMTFASPLYLFQDTIETFRMTVNSAANGQAYFCLSELAFFDSDGNRIELTEDNVTSNADHNALNPGSPDGGGFAALFDDDTQTYFHSAWRNMPDGAHYLDITLPNGGYDAFSFKMVARSPQNQGVRNQNYTFPGEMVIGIPDVLETPDGGLVNLADADPAKCYTITTMGGRGAWTVDAEGNSFTCTKAEGFDIDATDVRQQFAILSTNAQDYYLYSVSAKKFVKKDGSLVAGIADAIEFVDASSMGAGRVMVRFDESHIINVSDASRRVEINSWDILDAGNAVLIAEAGDFDATEALAMLSTPEVPDTPVVEPVDWTGTYIVRTSAIDAFSEDYTYPEEFEMVVEKSTGAFYVTKFLGYDTSIELVADKDGKSATMNLGGSYYGFTMLKLLGEVDGDYAYLALTDINGQSTSLDVTLNEDGSLSVSDFTVSYFLWMANTYEALALMSGVSATKAVVEAPKFEWVGEYTLTAKIKGTDETVSFDVEIQKNAYDGSYLITKFDGDAVYNLNYGGIALVIADDNKVATFDGGKYVGGTYPKYITINSADATTATIELAVNADGNITMDDFLYKEMDYETLETTDLATYSNVVLTKKATTESSIEIMSVNPADGASVESVSYIQLIFNEDVTVTMPEGGIEVKNTTTGEVFATSLYENEYMDKNMVMLQFDKNAQLTPGTYSYTIPAGMVKSVGGAEFAGQTFTFTVVEAFEIVNITPANGEVEKLETLSFTFNKAVAEVDLSKFTLYDPTYTYKFTLKDEVTFSEDRKTVTVELESPITACDHYDWSINAGAFISEDGVESEFLYMWFEIVDYSSSFSLMDINGYLNDGDRRQQLGNVIEIMFNNVNEVELVEGKTVTVYLPGASEVSGTVSKVNSSILVTFDQEFTEEGEYLIEIPAGMFTMDGVANEYRELIVELYTLHVTPLEVVSITNVEDENGHIVAIHVAYNQEIALAYNEYYEIISSNISLMDDKGNAISLVENYNGSLPWTTLEYVLGSLDEETWQITTTPLTEPGTYTLDLSQIVVRYGYNPDTWEYAAQGACDGIYTIVVEDKGPKMGDVNGDGQYTMVDVVMLVNAVLNVAQEGYYAELADMNGDGQITVVDVVAVVRRVLGYEPVAAARGMLREESSVALEAGSLSLSDNGELVLPVYMNNTGDYTAFQIDVVLPEGMALRSAALGERAKSSHCMTWSTLDNGATRIVAYAMNNATFKDNEDALMYLTLEANTVADGAVLSLVDGLFATANGTEDSAAAVSVMMRSETTGLDGLYGGVRISGAEGAVVVEAAATVSVNIYSLTGRLVQAASVSEGKTAIALPAGMYVVNGKKIIVK